MVIVDDSSGGTETLPPLERRRTPLPRRRGLDGLPHWLSLGTAACVAAAVVAGVASGAEPVLATAAIIGIGLFVVSVLDITAGLMLFAVAVCLESLPDLPVGASVAQLYALGLVAGWVLARASDKQELRGRSLLATSPALTWALTLFLAWVTLSSVWATDKQAAQRAAIYVALDVMIFPIALAALRTSLQVRALFICLVGGAVLAAAIALLSAGSVSGDDRLSGGGFNPNQLGLYLLAGTVLAATLAADRSLNPVARALLGFAVVVSPVLLLMTGSRGATVGLLVAVVLAPVLAPAGKRLRVLSVILGIALVCTVSVAAFAPAPVVKRLTTFEADQGSGRVDLWTIAWRMARDRPVTGVGAENFQAESPHYILQPGAILRDDLVLFNPQEAHSVYLGVLAELGVVGLALLLFVIGCGMLSLRRSARRFRDVRDERGQMLARGLLVAVASLACAMMFSANPYDKHFYLLLAGAPALAAISRMPVGQPRLRGR